MADRYVNYDQLLEERRRLGLDEMSMIHKVNAFNQFIDHLPTADVEEVKHGRWIRSGNEKKCSICGFIYYSNNDDWNWCPNCGAKMDGKR